MIKIDVQTNIYSNLSSQSNEIIQININIFILEPAEVIIIHWKFDRNDIPIFNWNMTFHEVFSSICTPFFINGFKWAPNDNL